MSASVCQENDSLSKVPVCAAGEIRTLGLSLHTTTTFAAIPKRLSSQEDICGLDHPLTHTCAKRESVERKKGPARLASTPFRYNKPSGSRATDLARDCHELQGFPEFERFEPTSFPVGGQYMTKGVLYL